MKNYQKQITDISNEIAEKLYINQNTNKLFDSYIKDNAFLKNNILFENEISLEKIKEYSGTGPASKNIIVSYSHILYLGEINENIKYTLNAKIIPLFSNNMYAISTNCIFQDFDISETTQRHLIVSVSCIPYNSNPEEDMSLDEQYSAKLIIFKDTSIMFARKLNICSISALNTEAGGGIGG